jgi:hypothetical protein
MSNTDEDQSVEQNYAIKIFLFISRWLKSWEDFNPSLIFMPNITFHYTIISIVSLPLILLSLYKLNWKHWTNKTLIWLSFESSIEML